MIAECGCGSTGSASSIKAVRSSRIARRRSLDRLANELDEIEMPSGRVLTREGEMGREFVVLVDGSAEVTKNGRRVNLLGAGDFLGEIALISGSPRTATVTTTSDADLLILTARSFARVTKEMPSVGPGERPQGALRAPGRRHAVTAALPPCRGSGRALFRREADRRRVLPGVAEPWWRAVGISVESGGGRAAARLRPASCRGYAPPKDGRTSTRS